MAHKANRNTMFIFLFIFFFGGCSSVSQDAKVILKTSVVTAKENALGFKLLSVFLIASEEKDDEVVKHYIQTHVEGLNMQAMALSDFAKAVELGSLKDSSRLQLIEMSKTARMRAEVFIQMRPHLALKAGSVDPKVWLDYMLTHEIGLKNQANMLEVLAEKLKKERENAD